MESALLEFISFYHVFTVYNHFINDLVFDCGNVIVKKICFYYTFQITCTIIILSVSSSMWEQFYARKAEY